MRRHAKNPKRTKMDSFKMLAAGGWILFSAVTKILLPNGVRGTLAGRGLAALLGGIVVLVGGEWAVTVNTCLFPVTTRFCIHRQTPWQESPYSNTKKGRREEDSICLEVREENPKKRKKRKKIRHRNLGELTGRNWEL